MSALDDARLMRDYPLTTYTAKETRKIALGLLELIEQHRIKEVFSKIDPRDLQSAYALMRDHNFPDHSACRVITAMHSGMHEPMPPALDLTKLERWNLDSGHGEQFISRDSQGDMVMFEDVEKLLRGEL